MGHTWSRGARQRARQPIEGPVRGYRRDHAGFGAPGPRHRGVVDRRSSVGNGDDDRPTGRSAPVPPHQAARTDCWRRQYSSTDTAWCGCPLRTGAGQRAEPRSAEVAAVRSGYREPQLCDPERADQESLAVGLPTDGRRAVADAVEVADVVIERSRPRALRQAGIDPEPVSARAVQRRRTGEAAHAVGFGDGGTLGGGFAAMTAGVPEDHETTVAEPMGRRRVDHAPGPGVRTAHVLRRMP